MLISSEKHRILSICIVFMIPVVGIVFLLIVYHGMFVSKTKDYVSNEFVSSEGEKLHSPFEPSEQQTVIHHSGLPITYFSHPKLIIHKPSHPLERLLLTNKCDWEKYSVDQYANVYPNAWLHLMRVKFLPTFRLMKTKETTEQRQHILACVMALREANPKLRVSTEDFVYDLDGNGEVRLFGPEVRDITPLREFVNMRRVVLANCDLDDISPISDFSQLDELMLYNLPKIRDIAPLANLTKLTELRLIGTNVNDLRPLQNLHGLEVLDVTANANLAEIAPLANCPNLYNVYFEATKIRDVAPLSQCSKLQYVNLHGTLVDDISSLPTNIKHLTVVNTQVGDVSRINAMPQLVAFYFYNTPAYWKQVTLYVVIPGLLIIIVVWVPLVRKFR